jgi:type I restriction-modification system DNA methylase subunit
MWSTVGLPRLATLETSLAAEILSATGVCDGILVPHIEDNHKIGQIFEELHRCLSWRSNKLAGKHHTPHDVIGLVIRWNQPYRLQ